MWLMLDVRQDDAKYLSLGQRVLFRPSDSPKRAAKSKAPLAWISTAADDRTRTVKVRVDLPNADGRLRANTFGTGRIVLREEPQADRRAQRSRPLGRLLQRRLRARQELFCEDGAQVLPRPQGAAGRQATATRPKSSPACCPGEVIASKNSVVLEAQLLKSNLGAGCGCCAGD